MARLMSENSVSHPDCSAASSSASTSNATSPSPRTSRKPAASTMATEENNNNTSPKRISLQRTSSTKLRGKTVSPPRRTSFKLQQIRPGGPKNGYRATKVTVPSNSVALLASRFNAVVVHNDAEGRKLLKRLNSQKQILHHTHKSTTIEGCVRAAIKKFESGDCGEHGDEHVVSSNQNSHHLQNAVDKGGKEKASHQNKNNHHHHHRLQNAVEKHGKEKVNNDDSHQNNNHHSRNGVEKNGKEKDNDVNQNSANVHHQQAERPKFVIVRKNSSISKFSRKSLQKTNVNSTQNSRLSSVESSKDVLMKSGSSVSSSGSSPVKSVRKFPNPPKPTPKPTINQRTIFLKPVLSKCTESSVRLKDNVDNGVSGSSVRLSRTVKEDHLKSSKTDVRLSRTVKEDKSSKTDVRNSGRADLDDSVFCSGDETDGKSSDGVPKTVKKIWRKYQVTNSRSISSIARDFINSDSSLDGSVVQTLKNVRENVDDSSTEKNGNKGSSKKDPDNNKHLVEQCEACETGVKSTQEVEKRNHSKLCRVQRRIHHGNEDSKVQKEVFRKYLVKSEHIMAVQNELLATNKKFDSKNVKETRNGNNVGKEHRRYGRIIVNDTKVLKSLVNDDVNNEDTVNKENLEKSIKHDSSVVGKNVQAITKNLEDTSVIASKPQVIKPKLQPKPSKLPECIRKVEVVAKEISTPAKSKPITTPGIRLSVAKDQTILESALNGTLLKEQNKLMNGDVSKNVKENCVMETGGMNKSGQKDFVKPNRSFLWNTLKDKESSQDLVVPVAETLVHNVTSTAESTKNEDVMSQPKPKEVFDANIRNNLDSKVKNTSFLFRKNVKSLPNDDSLDEPIYMNGQVALSTSDLDSRMSATDIGSNFSSMINGLDGVKSKTHITVVGSNLGTMKNGQVALNSNGDLARGRNKGHIIDAGSYSVATENGQIGQEGNIKLVGPNFTKDVDENEGQNEVYEEFGNSDNEGTIYEDLDASSVDGSPKTVPNDPNFKSVNVYITEERNTNIIQVETVNKVVIVSQQVAGYEEIEKESTKGSGGYSGSKLRYTHIDSDVATKRVTDDTYASITGQDVCENIYDDVIHLKPKIHAEVDSCHYECIYQSEIGGSSHSDSSCDQSNSLYGVVPGSKLSQSSYGVYQLNEPRANTSETSDEWIDLDTSGGDVEIYLYEKRNKPKVKSAGSWSQKVRRQWSAKQAGNSSWVSVTSNSVLYLTWSGDTVDLDNLNKSLNLAVKTNGLVSLRAILHLCQKYEAQEISVFLGKEDGSSDYENTSHQYEAVQGLHSTTTSSNIRRTVPRQEFSFDSDSSFEDDDEEDHPQRTSVPQGRPEEPPQQNEGIYGFMKQASKRMRKHWSLGKSLRRIRKMSVGTSLGTSVEEQEGSVTNGSNTSLNRRRWSSFKSKFRPQLSSSGSVFYLDKDQTDTPDCIPNVYIDKPSPTTPQPVATIATSTATTTTDTRRYSYASSSSVRPTSPPPPPPPPPHRQALCEELLAKRGVLKSPPGVERTGGVERSLAGVEKSPVGVEKSPTGIEKSPGNGEMALGNRSWQSENDDSWDRRMSGMDMMSDRSSSHGSDLHLRFADEPLYQFYNETVTKEELNKCYSTNDSSRGSIADFDSDGYEEIGSDRLLISRPSAMDLITPKQGHHRTLWCEIPEVVQSEILKTLSKEERRFQEAKFEVMTSEASYFKSLTVLEKHFANSPAFSGDESVLPTEDRKSLFGHLTAVRRCSERLLAALDRCWQESIMLSHLSDVVSQHARQHFHVYVTYCTNQIDLNCTLRRLKDTNKRFEEELTRLESDPMCESLSLHSFLMLPMQRVTRMPLLMDAILSKLDTHHAEYQSSKAALRILNEFVQKCNEATRQQERVIEMVKLSRQLEFSQDVRTLPIVSQSRWLVRSGQVVQLNNSGDGGGGTQKQTFGRKLTRQGVKVMLFLFNDAMLVTKKKSDDCFIVLDHCPRNLIQMSAEEDVGTALRYLIKVAMLKNHEGKLVEMIVSCDSETSRQRWLQAVAPPQASEEGESVYEAWDCPQVIAIHVYRASQPDELSIQRGDVINVLRKMADGWYYGERTRDGEKGWFPGNHAQEIISQHIRARNLQQRYRLLMMSGSILESQKGNTNNKKQK